MTTFEVTPLYALPLALIFLILWFRTSSKRSDLKLSIGDGGNADMLLRIRHHGNFVEWTSMVLILMILAEGMGAPPSTSTFRRAPADRPHRPSLWAEERQRRPPAALCRQRHQRLGHAEPDGVPGHEHPR